MESADVKDAPEKPTPTVEDIDGQINELEKQVAEFTQKLFQAQGALQLAHHMKETFKFEPRKIPEGEK